MTIKRRRVQESIWMDALRRRRTYSQLRRSVQHNQRTCEPISTPRSSTTRQVAHPHLPSPEAASQIPESNENRELVPNFPSHHLITPLLHGIDNSHNVPHSMTQTNPENSSTDDLREQNTTTEADDNSMRDPVVPDLEQDDKEEDESCDMGCDVDEEHEPEFQPFHSDTATTEAPPTNAPDVNNGVNPCTGQATSLNQAEDITPAQQQPCIRDPDGSTSNVDDGDNPDLDIYDKGNPIGALINVWKSSCNLGAIVAVVGSVRYTVQQYRFARDNIRDASEESTWPPYARTQRYFRRILEFCMPQSELVKLPKTKVDVKTALQDEEDDNEPDLQTPDLENPDNTQEAASQNDVTETVRVFLPSSWAQLDVATSVVFDQMFPGFHTYQESNNRLDNSTCTTTGARVTTCFENIFVKSGNHHILRGPGSLIAVTIQNEAPPVSHNYNIYAITDNYVLKGDIIATWTVGSSTEETHCIEDILNKQTLTIQYRDVISKLAKTSSPNPSDESEGSGVLPGDICTLLKPEHGVTDTFAVLVHRFWRLGDGLPSVILLWVQVPSRETAAQREGDEGVEYLECHVVDDVSYVRCTSVREGGNAPDQEHIFRGGGRTYGTLQDGTPFVIYKILLYCDDFQKSSAMHPKGSAGGCYFMPMSLPPEARRNTSAVRIVSLTPPGVSTNQVLHYIVEDLVNASVWGVNGHTPLGQKVKIFIEVLGFVGDYPASSSVIDVVGHVGRSPCTVCSFKRAQHDGTEGSRFGYTTEVHANNSAFMRYSQRHISLRKANISDDTAIALGMVAAKNYSDRTCPLLYFQRVLESRKSRSALTVTGEPVVPNTFDAFRHNFIAPDHLLTGLAKDALNAMYRSLPNNTLRLKADAMICEALRDNGLLSQKEVFNRRAHKLHSMTLSELSCVLLVSVPMIRQVIQYCPIGHIARECFKILSSLHSLIALTYWWPQPEIDGQDAVDLIRYKKDKYISDLRCMSKKYVRDVHNICKESEIIKKELDKPNLHRLIELYEHTLPTFGHVREVMELVFESAHQPLKRCISRSNNHDAHIFAVEHCFGNDWQGRIAALVRRLSHEEDEIRTAARRSLRRVLIGAQADLFDEQLHHNIISEVDTVLHDLFTPALRNHFEKDNMISNFSIEKRAVWKARGKMDSTVLSRILHITERDAEKLRALRSNGSLRYTQLLRKKSPRLKKRIIPSGYTGKRDGRGSQSINNS